MQKQRQAHDGAAADRNIGSAGHDARSAVVRLAVMGRKNCPDQRVERRRLLRRLIVLRKRPERQGVRPRQRRQSISHRRRQGLRRCRGAGAQAHHAAGEGKQVLDAVVHLSEEQPLLVFRAPAFRDFAGDLGCADDLAFRVSERRDRQGNVDQSPVLALPNGVVMLDALAAANACFKIAGSSLCPPLGISRAIGLPIASSAV